MPLPVFALLKSSLDGLSPDRGLRLRLCLDAPLVDLPWEFLYSPDLPDDDTLAGFLVLNPRLSIVREAPSLRRAFPTSAQRQRMVLAGTYWADWPGGRDVWEIGRESEKLIAALQPVREFLEPTPVVDAAGTGIDDALSRPAAVFHYSGHTDVVGGRGYLVKGVYADGHGGGLDRHFQDRTLWYDPLFAEALGDRLRRAETRLAVFSACNSGRWAFVEPLLRAGLPALVGTQGKVSVRAAIEFCAKLYGSLAIGLSLDEAVAWARLHLLQAALSASGETCEWGTFMVYLPVAEAVIFPRPQDRATRDRQEAARRDFGRTIINVYTTIGYVAGGAQVFGVAARDLAGLPGRPHGGGPYPTSEVPGDATGGPTRPTPALPLHPQPIHHEDVTMAAKPMIYHDFEIEMSGLRDDGGFTVRVHGSTPGGEMRADEAESPVFNAAEFKDALGRLERRKLPLADLMGLGEKLAALLLPVRVLALYDRSLAKLPEAEGLRVRLRIESLELAALPWEFAHVRRTQGEPVAADFLCLQRRVSIVRHEVTGEASPAPVSREKLRIAVALANPLGTAPLDVDADERAILAAVNDLQAKTQAVEPVVVKGATRERLLQAVAAGTDIFHFAGHGVFEGTELAPDGTLRKRGKVILETDQNQEDRYDSEQLAVVLGNAGVRLVILGACSSAARDAGGAWTGVAPSLVRQNIPAVVAMQYPVRDHNAAAFMAHLYVRVLAGFTIDEAVFEGRQAIFNRAKGEERDWGVPVLYLRARDGILFPLPPPQATGGEGPLIEVQRKLGTVRGKDIAVTIRDMLAGRVLVNDTIDVVEEGGESKAVVIDTLGGRSPRGPESDK